MHAYREETALPQTVPHDPSAGLGLSTWAARLRLKRDACLRVQKSGALWLYHNRKCGGTSVRAMLEKTAAFYSVPFWESEGRSIDRASPPPSCSYMHTHARRLTNKTRRTGRGISNVMSIYAMLIYEMFLREMLVCAMFLVRDIDI